MNILIAPDDRLKQPCRRTGVVRISTLAEMFALMDRHKGVGLAAPQVGILERFFVTSWGDIFINPEIVPVRELGKEVGREGCLSIPGKAYDVERWRAVEVNGRRYEGPAAIVIQHETDHLDGILISERGTLCNSGRLSASSPSS